MRRPASTIDSTMARERVCFGSFLELGARDGTPRS
jgi:hypothetical protein